MALCVCPKVHQSNPGGINCMQLYEFVLFFCFFVFLFIPARYSPVLFSHAIML